MKKKIISIIVPISITTSSLIAVPVANADVASPPVAGSSNDFTSTIANGDTLRGISDILVPVFSTIGVLAVVGGIVAGVVRATEVLNSTYSKKLSANLNRG